MRYTTRFVVAGVLGLSVSLAAGLGGDEQNADNPHYKHWAGFKQGTTAVLTETTRFGDDATDELPGGVDEKVVRYKLLSVTPKQVVVEAVVFEKEFLNTTEAAPTKIIYPAKVNQAHVVAVLLATGAKRGEETLKVKPGKEEKEIKCQTITGSRKKGSEEVRQMLWLSMEVPGGVVKRTRAVMRDGKLVAETTTMLKSYKVAE
jgi:hypothetical protein